MTENEKINNSKVAFPKNANLRFEVSCLTSLTKCHAFCSFIAEVVLKLKFPNNSYLEVCRNKTVLTQSGLLNTAKIACDDDTFTAAAKKLSNDETTPLFKFNEKRIFFPNGSKEIERRKTQYALNYIVRQIDDLKIIADGKRNRLTVTAKEIANVIPNLWNSGAGLRENIINRNGFLDACDFETRLSLDLIDAIDTGKINGTVNTPAFLEPVKSFETSAMLAMVAGTDRLRYRR